MSTKRMSQAKQRQRALGAVRSQLRHMGVSSDAFLPFDHVLAVLDDLSRTEPEVIASQWYVQASQYQLRWFRREWKQAVQPVYTKTLWDTEEQTPNVQGG